eukprot:14686327-Alexandrium_andersonii.AAC.1
MAAGMAELDDEGRNCSGGGCLFAKRRRFGNVCVSAEVNPGVALVAGSPGARAGAGTSRSKSSPSGASSWMSTQRTSLEMPSVSR